MPPLFVLPFPAFDPVLISIGPISIRWYALAYIAGILLGWLYARALIRAERLERDGYEAACGLGVAVPESSCSTTRSSTGTANVASRSSNLPDVSLGPIGVPVPPTPTRVSTSRTGVVSIVRSSAPWGR